MSILGEEPVTVLRYSEEIIAGRPVRELEDEFVILGSVQPVTGSQRELLPEAIRARVELVCYTKSEVRNADDQVAVTGDIIAHDGAYYEVIRVQTYRAVLPHREAYLARLEAAPVLPDPGNGEEGDP